MAPGMEDVSKLQRDPPYPPFLRGGNVTSTAGRVR
jgi:hypothetical protein